MSEGAITHRARADFPTLVRAGDVVVANDAATLPASLAGVHVPTGGAVEVRLAGRDSLLPRDVTRFTAVVFGAGDFRTPTEHRPPPPVLHPGDALRLGPLRAIVLARAGASAPDRDALREPGGGHLGRPGPSRPPDPVRLRSGAAGDLGHVDANRQPAGGIRAALGGIHPRLGGDRLAPRAGRGVCHPHARRRHLLDGRCRARSAAAARRAVRHPVVNGGIDRGVQGSRRPGDRHRHNGRAGAGTRGARRRQRSAWRGIATQRIGPLTPLRCVDAIVSGTHEPGTSHYELLRAFQDDDVLRRMEREADARGYRTHEFGDSVWLERATPRQVMVDCGTSQDGWRSVDTGSPRNRALESATVQGLVPLPAQEVNGWDTRGGPASRHPPVLS